MHDENEKPVKVSNINKKREQIMRERMQRHINSGKTPQQAWEAVQREDYEKLPLDKKFERVEKLVARNAHVVATDLGAVRENQNILSDALDVNFRAFEMMLVELGMPIEKQKEFMKKAEEEIAAVRRMQEEERARQAAQTKAAVEKAEVEKSIDQPAPEGEEAKLPDGATVFGE